jgi:MFS family permease
MLSDSFPAERRATAFALYAAGLYVGQGIGYYLGGWILDVWSEMYPDGDGLFGLRGWQAAFLAVGLPGLLLALAVYGLREPAREQVDAGATAAPGRTLLAELSAVIPPLTLWSLMRAGASRGALALNVGVGLAIAVSSALLVGLLGPPEQWIALGIGGYAAFSWAQGLALRDRPAFALLFRGRASVALLLGAGVMTVITYAFMFWSAPFLQRAHGVSAREAGFYLMIASVFGGGLGVTFGGWLSDEFKRRWPAGRVHVIVIGLLLEIPSGLGFLFAESERLAFAMAVAFNVASTLWVGSTNAVITELVIPRMRAIATAVMLTGYTFIGLALGPYAVGRISDALAAGGHSQADALRWGLTSSMLVLVPSLLLLLRGARTIAGDEASVFGRARQAGEPLA